jgi:predicted  nucleic acid-binding Zn-ribbon protein
MDEYQRILENESKLKRLYHQIYQHSYIKQKKEITAFTEKVNKEVENWTQKVSYFERKRKIRRSALELEQERLHFHSQNIAGVKDQTTYLQSKAEKKISEKFVEKYQKEIKELGMQQKRTQDNLQKLLSQKEELHKKLEEKKELFEKETKDYKKQYDGFIKEQEEQLQKLQPKFYDYFFQLHQEHKFPVMIAVKDNYCRGCDMTFPPQIFQKVLSDTYAICSNCQRILIIDSSYFQDKDQDKKK